MYSSASLLVVSEEANKETSKEVAEKIIDIFGAND